MWNALKDALANLRNYHMEKESVQESFQTSEPPSIEDSELKKILSDLKFAKQVMTHLRMTCVGNSEVGEDVANANVTAVTVDEDDSSAIEEQKV